MGFLSRLLCLSNPRTTTSAHTLNLASSGPGASTSKVSATSDPLPAALAPTTAPAPAAKPAPPAPRKPVASKPSVTSESYTPARALALFSVYADADEPDTIGPEGLERLCVDADVAMEGAGPLVLAWLLGTREMGNVRKEEWVKGMESLQCVHRHLLFAGRGVNFGKRAQDIVDSGAHARAE